MGIVAPFVVSCVLGCFVMADAFDEIRDKVKRADEHIGQLQTEINTFLDEAPDRVLVDYDSQSAEEFRRFHESRVVPRHISIIVGEILFHLRSSLDYAASIFIRRGGGTLNTSTGFPVFPYRPTKPDDIGRYKGKIPGIDPAGQVWAIIEKAQPYRAGNKRPDHLLNILNGLHNADKHRALALHTVSVKPHLHLSLVAPERAPADVLFDDIGGSTVGVGSTIGEYEIVNVKRQLTTDVAFSEFGTRTDAIVSESVELLRAYTVNILGKLWKQL